MISRRDFLTLRFLPGQDRRTPPPDGKFALADIGSLGDAVLLRMVPVLRCGWSAQVLDDGLAWWRPDGSAGRLKLPPGERAAVALFDGRRTVAEVGALLEGQGAAAPGQGPALARAAFVASALHLVFQPDSLPPPET